MDVLIFEPDPDLGGVWANCLQRQGAKVTLTHTQDQALAFLHAHPVQVIVLNLVLGQGSAFAIADYANYRHPNARVMFVTNTSFFSDGSIFQLVSNTCAFLPTNVPPEDLAAMVEHYGSHT